MRLRPVQEGSYASVHYAAGLHAPVEDRNHHATLTLPSIHCLAQLDLPTQHGHADLHARRGAHVASEGVASLSIAMEGDLLVNRVHAEMTPLSFHQGSLVVQKTSRKNG
jgi:hypothetical protein